MIRTNLVSESFDSTQLLTHNGFTGIDSYQLTTQNGFLKIDSNRLTTQKASRIFWVKSTHDSKKTFQDFDSNQLVTQKIWNIDLNQVMTQWFESTVDFVDFFGFYSILLTFFGFSLNLVYLFWAFTKFRWPFLGIQLSDLIRFSSWLKQHQEDSSRFNSWLKRLSRNRLGINSWLKWIPQVLIQIDSWLKVLPHFSIQINSWLKQKIIWFWFVSWFDSESYPCLPCTPSTLLFPRFTLPCLLLCPTPRLVLHSSKTATTPS